MMKYGNQNSRCSTKFQYGCLGVGMSNNEKKEKTLACYKPRKSQEILGTQLPNFSEKDRPWERNTTTVNTYTLAANKEARFDSSHLLKVNSHTQDTL